MRRLRPALLSVLVALVLSAGLAPSLLAQEPARTVRDTVPLSPDDTLSVDNHEGRITVTTWARDRVRYEARILPTDEDPEAEKVTIRTERDGDRLRLATVHEEGDDESVVFGITEDGFQWGGVDIPDVHYTITMPRSAGLVVSDHASTIDVADHTGTLRIDSHEGPITVEKHRGALTIDSHESPVSVTDQTGDVTIDTHEGTMELRRVEGRLAVDTHDGDLTVTDLDGGFWFDAHDGSATASFSALSDDVVADTHDGDVTLTLPADASFSLNTDLDDAELTSSFDLAPIREAEGDVVNVRGDVHGGGPTLRLTSYDGTFALQSH
jgi:hypothetical protein